MKLTLIKANTDLGVMVDGSDLGPEVIYNHFLNDKRINRTVSIDKECIVKSKNKDDKAKNLVEVNNFNSKLYDCVIKEKNDGFFPIVLGGDHSLAIASALASIKVEKKLGIIWIDSHGDYNTFETTRTGNLHGLPLATINYQTGEKLSPYHSGPYYDPKNTVIIGGRDIDDWEMPNIKKAGVTLFTTNDIKKQGIDVIIKKAMKIALQGTNGVHISYDLDVIDPNIAPGVSVPAIHGINDVEAYEIVNKLLEYRDYIKSFDLVELNPTKDVENKTERIAVNLVEKIINSK